MMKFVKCALLTLLIMFCVGGVANAEDMLLLYGEDFSWAFKVSEPTGWKGVVNDATRNNVNIYFRLPGYDFDSSPALMYIRILSKNGLPVSKLLQADMDDFSKRKKKIAFEEFDIPGLKFEYAAQKYLINNDQIDYLCYIDTNEQSSIFAVLVLTAPSELAEKYREDFVYLVRSFSWWSITPK
jgi:hypothetical protein